MRQLRPSENWNWQRGVLQVLGFVLAMRGSFFEMGNAKCEIRKSKYENRHGPAGENRQKSRSLDFARDDSFFLGVSWVARDDSLKQLRKDAEYFERAKK